MSIFNRRIFLRTAAAVFVSGLTLSTTSITTPAAHAVGPILGTVIDYSAGVPSEQAIKKAGHLGSVRYVSKRRPGAEWMLGKPVTLTETQAQANAGLKVAFVYQFGRDTTADWKQGAAGAAVHAPQAMAIHAQAGGPKGRPIYVAIDDNPTREQYDSLIKPYLQAFNQALASQGYSMGIYGNYSTIDWAIQDGLGSYFWQHDWGSNGKIHPRTTIHQKAKNQQDIDGITVDVNHVYAADWGQWTPGQAPDTPAPTQPNTAAMKTSIPLPNGSLDGQTINQLGNTVNSMSSQIPGGQQIPIPSAQQIDAVLNMVK